MAVYYSEKPELDVRLITAFGRPALDLLETTGFTETVTAQFGLFHRMAQSIRLHPTEWAVQGDRTECGVVYRLDSLQLVVFDACWADAVGERQLTFFETYQRFRDAFHGEIAVTKRDVNGVRVEVVQYGEAGDNGILSLDTGPGTVAVWQIGERGFALIDQGNPLDGGRTAFDLPGLPVTIVAPAGYGVVKNGEYLRRGSYISFDFTPYSEPPRLYEIQFFSEASLRAFEERCTSDFCFEGDYPDLERYHAQRAALAQCTDLPPYENRRFGDRCYLVSNLRCTGDACVIREYTAFLEDTKVDVWIMMQNTSQGDASDALFAVLGMVEQ